MNPDKLPLCPLPYSTLFYSITDKAQSALHFYYQRQQPGLRNDSVKSKKNSLTGSIMCTEPLPVNCKLCQKKSAVCKIYIENQKHKMVQIDLPTLK